jgi:hypothetical protein
MPKKGPYEIPFVPSKEWTANYIHLMRWGWYPGTTEPRLYKPSDPLLKALWENQNFRDFVIS